MSDIDMTAARVIPYAYIHLNSITMTPPDYILDLLTIPSLQTVKYHHIANKLRPEDVEYLSHRYPHEDVSLQDRIAYLHMGYESSPRCPVCDGYLKRRGTLLRGKTCSHECGQILTAREKSQTVPPAIESFDMSDGQAVTLADDAMRTYLEQNKDASIPYVIIPGLSVSMLSYLVARYPGDGLTTTDRLVYFRAGCETTPSCPVCGSVPPRLSATIRTCCSKKCATEHKRRTGMMGQMVETAKKTNLERYGVEYTTQTDQMKKASRQTNLERLGVEYPSQSAEVRQKVKKTLIENYGVENPMASPELREKIRQTNLERYGFEHAQQNPTIRAKSVATNLEKYGTTSPSQAHIFNYDQYVDDDAFTSLYMSKTMVDLEKHFNLQATAIYRRARFLGLTTPSSSKAERDIAALVESAGHPIVCNSRAIIPPLELDIYIPELKLAIEYCGLYWHSEDGGKKPKSYHVNKLNACEAQDIRLITIFEDEWEFKQSIVRSRLLNLLGKSETIYARKCDVRAVSLPTASEFLATNHIQGRGRAHVRYGLFHQDQLVSVMTFSSSNYAKKQKGWEIDRFCNRLGATVVGGASRLFTHFTRTHPDVHEVVSFADRRWSDGGLYKKLGMTEVSQGQPNYWYTSDYASRISRVKFQKARIPDVDLTLTEWQNMQSRGYDRVWDCGSRKYRWARDGSQI